MKKVLIILAIVVTLSALGGTVYAAEESLPGDALYPVKLGVERLTMMSQGDDTARAERCLNFATKRVREMVTLTERERLGSLGSAAERYCYALNMSLATMERVRNRGADTGNVTARLAEAMAQHLSVLDEVYNATPDEAKPAMTRAMEQALQCYRRAIQIREQLRLQVSELPAIPPALQERVEQRVRERAQAGGAGSGNDGANRR